MGFDGCRSANSVESLAVEVDTVVDSEVVEAEVDMGVDCEAVSGGRLKGR